MKHPCRVGDGKDARLQHDLLAAKALGISGAVDALVMLAGDARDRLIQLQHDNTDLVVSTLHAHLTHDLCLEVIVLRGPAARLQKIAAQLRGLKGIFKGELVMASAEHQ